MPHPAAATLFVLVLAAAWALAAVPAAAKLEKPAYVAGDRWVYDLRGSLSAFPGTNASDVGMFAFNLVGRVDVDVVGLGTATVGGSTIPVVRVATRGTGFLNGTFEAPPGGPPGTVSVTGSFVALSSDLWETAAYLPVGTIGTTTYLATVSYLVTIDLATSIRLDARTTYGSVPPFDLDLGASASTAFTTDVTANTTVTGLGPPISSENSTTVSGLWTREVLGETNVTVDAGTFPAVVMNQTLTGFPGLSGIVPMEGANETAYYSAAVGSYVKREAYTNGTEVAEMTLRSTTYPYRPGLSALDVVLYAGLPIAVLAAVALFLFRRRRRRTSRTSARGEPPAR